MATFDETAQLPVFSDAELEVLRQRHAVLQVSYSTPAEFFELYIIEAVLTAAIREPLRNITDLQPIFVWRFGQQVFETPESLESFMDGFLAVQQIKAA
jgi:hypothetical protein